MTTRQLTSRRDAGIALARLYRLARSSRMLAHPEARPLARLIVNSVPVPVRNLFLNVSRETGRASGKETAASSASAVTRTGTDKDRDIASRAEAAAQASGYWRTTTSEERAELQRYSEGRGADGDSVREEWNAIAAAAETRPMTSDMRARVDGAATELDGEGLHVLAAGVRRRLAAGTTPTPTTSTREEAQARYRVQAESESVSGLYLGDSAEVEARQDAAAGDVVSGSSSPSSPTLAQRLGRIVDQAAELARWASDTQRRSMHQAVADVAEDVGTIASSALAPVVDAVTRPIERALAPVGSGLGIGLAMVGGLWLLSRR